MWRKICHVEKSQIYMHERCGKIWNFSTCGVISNCSKWQMWRNLKFLHSWHVYDVENVFKCVHVMLFFWKNGFVVIYAVCLEICFDAIYALLCLWRKNDKYEVCSRPSGAQAVWPTQSWLTPTPPCPPLWWMYLWCIYSWGMYQYGQPVSQSNPVFMMASDMFFFFMNLYDYWFI